MRKIYLRFLSLADALEGAPLSGIDETAKHLLQLIVMRHGQGQPLTVTDAMALSHVASPATIHRKLDALKQAGLIVQTFDGGNRRTKYLTPTQAADEHFDRLGQVMSSAVNLG